MAEPYGFGARGLDLRGKVAELSWSFILVLTVISSMGFVMLYSVADGSLDPWASRQMMRFGIGMSLLIVMALVDVRVWRSLAYPIYAVALVMLVAVAFVGTGSGSQRWLDLGPFVIQPSEIMKVALVLALARYFHARSLDDAQRFVTIMGAGLLIAVPSFLVLRQPDLGTSFLLLMSGVGLIFVSGAPMRYFIAMGVAGIAAIPVGWNMLHDYQRDRVLTFFDPDRDPLGAGYHILQSKIAFGSGGLLGRGFMQGTQAHLNFLPEKHTDFIFTMMAEELGLVGGFALLGLYALVLLFCINVALQARTHFGRLVCLGVAITFFLYVFINVAMVMGIVPVVGVPLPLVSYGGTAMLTLMVGFGLVMSVHVHRGQEATHNPIVFW